MPVARPVSSRFLNLRNLHTDEAALVEYWREGLYIPQGVERLSRILRDHRTNEAVMMDARLFDILHTLQHRLENNGEVEIISGYRSPRSNAYLAEASSGVARNSLHMRGMAMDIRIPTVSLASVRETAIAMEQGGVGYYPASDFVHIDTGPVRIW